MNYTKYKCELISLNCSVPIKCVYNIKDKNSGLLIVTKHPIYLLHVRDILCCDILGTEYKMLVTDICSKGYLIKTNLIPTNINTKAFSIYSVKISKDEDK